MARIEIISRKDGVKAVKLEITGKPQWSYNSYGHLCLRTIEDGNSDTLVVLDQEASREGIRFIKNNINF